MSICHVCRETCAGTGPVSQPVIDAVAQGVGSAGHDLSRMLPRKGNAPRKGPLVHGLPIVVGHLRALGAEEPVKASRRAVGSGKCFVYLRRAFDSFPWEQWWQAGI